MSTIRQTAATPQNTATSPDTALEFSLNTNPDPVRVSPSSGNVERADLVIIASRRSGDAIECNKIVLVIPTGPNSPDLALDLDGIDAQTSLNWTPSTNPQAKTITFAPASGHATISRDEGITIQLMGVRINRQVGTAPLIVQVYARKAGTNGAFQPTTTTLEIGKFPADFYLRNFKAEPLIIDNGDTITLKWEAGGASSLRLLYDTADINVLNQSTYTVPDVTHTTVFYLRATVQSGNNTVERILSSTATVKIPDLEVRNLTVTGTTSTKDLTVAKDSTLIVDKIDCHPYWYEPKLKILCKTYVEGEFTTASDTPTSVVALACQTYLVHTTSDGLEWASKPAASAGVAMAVLDVMEEGSNGVLTVESDYDVYPSPPMKTNARWEGPGSVTTSLLVPKGAEVKVRLETSTPGKRRELRIYWFSLGLSYRLWGASESSSNNLEVGSES